MTPNPYKMTVEAYVVTKMNTPFILGNDFASHFKLSIIRKDQTTQVVLGSSDRQIEAQESDTNPRTDDAGNVFFVEIHPDFRSNLRRNAEKRKKSNWKSNLSLSPDNSTPVYLAKAVNLKPESLARVPIEGKWEKGQNEGLIE
jgi:hypothetical protein